MIGSHNSFTFKKSVNKLFNIFKCFWQCQNKSLQEQYESGVRFFDIRIYRKDKSHWGIAHGLVNLYGGFDTIETILHYMASIFPEAYYRILLEKGDNSVVETFEDEVADAITALGNYSKLYEAIIKQNWKIVYHNDHKEFIIHDYCYTPILTGESFWYNIKHFKLSSIKSYAKKHNPKITEDLKNDQITVHFMDFI